MDPFDNYLIDIKTQFIKHKGLIENSIHQINEKQFFHQINEESNSIAILVKHLSGNLISRWSKFLTSDGEKPDRNRETEFIIAESDTKENLMNRLEFAWQVVFETFESLTADALGSTIFIRGEPHTVIEAINRGATHCAYHTGQIVYLAKYFSSKDWHSLSIPKGKTNEFNEKMKKNWAK